jgi:cytochrome b involved in lipid metabolism
METKLLILLQWVEHNQKYWKKNYNLVTKVYFSKRMTKRPKYFTPNEVSIHNAGRDIWVSFLGKVYNLTPLIQENAGNWKYYSICFSKSELKKERFLNKKKL